MNIGVAWVAALTDARFVVRAGAPRWRNTVLADALVELAVPVVAQEVVPVARSTAMGTVRIAGAASVVASIGTRAHVRNAGVLPNSEPG